MGDCQRADSRHLLSYCRRNICRHCSQHRLLATTKHQRHTLFRPNLLRTTDIYYLRGFTLLPWTNRISRRLEMWKHSQFLQLSAQSASFYLNVLAWSILRQTRLQDTSVLRLYCALSRCGRDYNMTEN